jgi:hypothetical protein
MVKTSLAPLSFQSIFRVRSPFFVILSEAEKSLTIDGNNVRDVSTDLTSLRAGFRSTTQSLPARCLRLREQSVTGAIVSLVESYCCSDGSVVN